MVVVEQYTIDWRAKKDSAGPMPCIFHRPSATVLMEQRASPHPCLGGIFWTTRGLAAKEKGVGPQKNPHGGTFVYLTSNTSRLEPPSITQVASDQDKSEFNSIAFVNRKLMLLYVRSSSISFKVVFFCCNIGVFCNHVTLNKVLLSS